MVSSAGHRPARRPAHRLSRATRRRPGYGAGSV